MTNRKGNRLCPLCVPGVPNDGSYYCSGCLDHMLYDGDDWEDVYDDEPTGSCEECDINLYRDEDYGGLCSNCAWIARGCP